MSTVTFIGAGSFGTALSTIVAAKGCRVNIFDIDKAHLDRMEAAMENTDYLPGVKLVGDYHFYTDNEAALKDADVIVFSLPAQHFRSALKASLPFIKHDALAMNIAKGIEQKTLMRMSEVAEEVGFDMNRYACISGPSHAEEVGIGVPTAVSVSSRDPRTARSISDLFSTNRFRIYTNTDMLGMELAGSVKNVMAVGSGIIDGMGFGDNTRAAMMTRGIAEMTRLGMALGAKFETFAGLSGVGDMIVTCTSMHSRNNRAGFLIGQGKSVDEAVREIGMVVEGMNALPAAVTLCEKYEMDMPLINAVQMIVRENAKPSDVVKELMNRSLKTE